MIKTFSFLLALFSITLVVAQDDAGKSLKKATRNIANYNLDPAANSDALDEAVTLMNDVVKDAEFKNDSKAWTTYGSAYGEIVNRQTQARVLNPEAPVTNPEAVAKTFEGFKNGVAYAQKSYETKDAIKGLEGFMPNMHYLASQILTAGDYENAYAAYKALTEGEKLLEENESEGIFATEKEFNDNLFLTAFSAYNIGEVAETAALLEELRSAGYTDAALYEYLYKSYTDLDKGDKASEVLSEGRVKFPDDKGLLFAEINDALGKGDLPSLVEKLKAALAAEPDNVTVPTTLGNVYEQMYQTALQAGDMEAAHQHFDSAKVYIGKALATNPDHFEAVYMMGALEYNKAAELANEVNALSEDYTKEGTKKWEDKKAEMMAQFEKALPHFQKAETLNPEDANTLIALREIWTRKDDFEKSNAYKEKLERLTGNQ